MKSFFLRTVVFALLMGPLAVWAQDAATSDGKMSEQLAANLYCDTGSLLQGNLGLILGLLLVFMGLWSLIQGGKLMAALPLIFVGAAIPMLPSIIEASFMGLGGLLQENNITGDSSKGFEPPNCKALPPSASWSEPSIEYCPETGSNFPAKAGCAKPGSDPTPGKAGR